MPAPAGLLTWMTVAVTSFAALLFCATLLISLRLEKALTDLVQDRAVLIARQLADSVEGGLRVGIRPEDQTENARKIDGLMDRDAGVLLIALLDGRGQTLVQRMAGTVVGQKPDPVTAQRHLARMSGSPTAADRVSWSDARGIQVVISVKDATGLVSGAVWVVYSLQAPQSAFNQSIQRLGGWSVALSAGFAVLVLAGLALVRRATEQAFQKLAASTAAPSDSRGWPIFPLPQALGTLGRLEAQWAELCAKADSRGRP